MSFLHPVKVSTRVHHFGRRANLCSLASSAVSHTHESSSSSSKGKVSGRESKSQRKAARNSPEGQLRQKLDRCSKTGNLDEALRLYDEARSSGVILNQHVYNVLLYLCSSPAVEGSEVKLKFSELGLSRGFEIFKQMVNDKVDPNEATFTNAARLAAGLEDPDMAFELVKKMKSCNIPPKLRSYGPALFGYCISKEMADRAYEVYLDMVGCRVVPEEPEVSALLKVSADAEKGDRVYEMLHKLRTTVRQVSESTMNVVEDWFKSDAAGRIGKVKWDVRKVKEGVVKGGGGWHGQGWLGSGAWNVARTRLNEDGVCCACAEKLVCIDIDPRETEHFASSYWLYAAVRFKSLLVTNDEMRDHLFQLLGTSFFPRWKEKHQVRISVSTSGVKLHMPPPYSIVTQESETGSWHVPMKMDDGLETTRQWLCATRQRA
ncbi:Proteinaceous RNase P 1, chloroplastic/mitochondrial [Linum grandiflorum]